MTRNYTLSTIPTHAIDPSDGRAVLRGHCNPQGLLYPQSTQKGENASVFQTQMIANIGLVTYGAAVQNVPTMQTGMLNVARNLTGRKSRKIAHFLEKNNKNVSFEKIQATMYGLGMVTNAFQAFGNVAPNDLGRLLGADADDTSAQEARTGYAAVSMYALLSPGPLMKFHANATMLETDYDQKIMKDAFHSLAEEQREKLEQHYDGYDNIPIIKAMNDYHSPKIAKAKRMRLAKNIMNVVGGALAMTRAAAFQTRNAVENLMDAINNHEGAQKIVGTALGVVTGALFMYGAYKMWRHDKAPELKNVERVYNADDFKDAVDAFKQDLNAIQNNDSSANNPSIPQPS